MFINQKHEEAYQLVKSGEYTHALDAFNEALRINPDNADIYSDRGVLFIHMKKEVEALADFNYAVKLQPGYSYRYSARAYALDFFGQTQEAIKDYERAIQLDPKDAVAYNNLGLLQEKLGYKKVAEQNFDRADKLAKAEEQLFKLMDNLEGESNEPSESPTPVVEAAEEVHREPIPPIDKMNDKKSALREFRELFTSKKQFSSFIRYIRNGFKIK